MWEIIATVRDNDGDAAETARHLQLPLGLRLLLDEMLSPAIARELRERGHDFLAISEHPGWAALSDPEVLATARTERRAIVTNNLRDYRPLHADAITPGGPGHFGMVFMPGSYRRTKAEPQQDSRDDSASSTSSSRGMGLRSEEPRSFGIYEGGQTQYGGKMWQALRARPSPRSRELVPAPGRSARLP